MRDKKIIHIIPGEKFTSGYVNFMEKRFTSLTHVFIICSDKYGLKLDKKKYYEDIKIVDKWSDFYADKYMDLLKGADQIIISGVFAPIGLYGQLYKNKEIWSKSFLQFWGGDFYSYRNAGIFSKKWLKKKMLGRYIKKCGGIINLIPSDYDELLKIFPNDRLHFVASMPTTNKPDLSKYISKGDKVRIIVGNSAAPENCHRDILAKMACFKDENMEVVCPLSYGGNEDYVNDVIKFGSGIFGKKFIAISDYMDFEDYLHLLGAADVGVFYNNRQQAMGNIKIFLQMGKKVYLREGTAMWKDYTENGIKVFSADGIPEIDFKKFITFSEQDGYNNIKAITIRDEKYENGWEKVLKWEER